MSTGRSIAIVGMDCRFPGAPNVEAFWDNLKNGVESITRFRDEELLADGIDPDLLQNLCASREFIESLLNFKKIVAFQTYLGNDKDYLTSRVAYKLNLKGPAIPVQTACSTSLVAICQACQSLLLGQCDMALAGGVTITFPRKKGYLYQEGGMLSPDGHCRAFDVGAQGTVFGNGVGVVVLKRLEDALADGDTVHAIVRGAALNNDGSGKVSYTAP